MEQVSRMQQPAGAVATLKRKLPDAGCPRITPSEYAEFQQRSCLRAGGFTATYYTLGLVEEASEVFEAARRGRPGDGGGDDDDVVKEVGDVLWYATGLLHSCGMSLSDMVAGDFVVAGAGVAEVEGSPETDLMVDAGALAGRMKKFERKDYDEEALRGFVRQIMPRLLGSLGRVCAGRQRSLLDAAERNRSKIEKRMAVGMLRGDGDNREDARLRELVRRTPTPCSSAASTRRISAAAAAAMLFES